MFNIGIPRPNPLHSSLKRRGGSFKGGEEHPQSVLTDKKVMNMRRAHAEGLATHEELAKKYKIAVATVSRVITGSRWGHLPVLHVSKARAKPVDGIRWRKHPKFKDYAISENGDVQDLYTREFLLPILYNKGVMGVKINRRLQMVQRLMLEAFEGYPPNDGQPWRAHFKDLDRSHLHIDNLEWMVHRDVCRAYRVLLNTNECAV
jgi:hypothetical protein